MRLFAGLLLAAACAAPRSAQVLRIHANHYQSMTGVKVGGEAGAMSCNRESITGSHIIQWYCRFEAEGPQYQLGLPVQLVLSGR